MLNAGRWKILTLRVEQAPHTTRPHCLQWCLRSPSQKSNFLAHESIEHSSVSLSGCHRRRGTWRAIGIGAVACVTDVGVNGSFAPSSVLPTRTNAHVSCSLSRMPSCCRVCGPAMCRSADANASNRSVGLVISPRSQNPRPVLILKDGSQFPVWLRR
jgi:hypothetical protein